MLCVVLPARRAHASNLRLVVDRRRFRKDIEISLRRYRYGSPRSALVLSIFRPKVSMEGGRGELRSNLRKGTWEDGSRGIDRKGRIEGNGRWGCSVEGSRTNGRAGRRRAGGGEEEALPYDGNLGRCLGPVGRGDEWRPLKLSNENVERVVGNKNGCQATHQCTSVSSSF